MMDIKECFEYYKNSKFGRLEHKRFSGKDNEVNWALDDKIAAYNFVDNYAGGGVISHPQIVAKIQNIEELNQLYTENILPNKFVIKISNGHSAIGVMLLRSIGEKLYFDDISMCTYTLEEVVKKQKEITQNRKHVIRETYWFIEETVENFVEIADIPFDYKVHCINGVPKLVWAIDRNDVKHPAVTIFDGNFIPLKDGVDYCVNYSLGWRRSVHCNIIPPNAFEILTKSAQIAKDVDKKYVRIDWYNGKNGACFGEFTFASGASNTGEIVCSQEITDEFDKCLNEAIFSDYTNKGYSVNSEELYKAIRTVPLNFNTFKYNELLKKCVYGNYAATEQMAAYFKELAQKSADATQKKLYQHLYLCWFELSLENNKNRLEYLIRDVYNKIGFISDQNEKFKFREEEAEATLKNLSLNNDWYKCRYAQFVLIFRKDFEKQNEAKHTIIDLAAKGNAYAQTICHAMKLNL